MLSKQAFPIVDNVGCSDKGLTKLEWFAGMALANSALVDTGHFARTAEWCFVQAEAMLKESEKRK